MFIKGTILGFISKEPIIDQIPNRYDTGETQRTKLSITCYRRWNKETQTFNEDTFNFICFGKVRGATLENLSKGDMVFAEFEIRKSEFQNSEGNMVEATNYIIRSIQKMYHFCHSSFREEMKAKEEELIEKLSEKESEIKMEDIF